MKSCGKCLFFMGLFLFYTLLLERERETCILDVSKIEPLNRNFKFMANLYLFWVDG